MANKVQFVHKFDPELSNKSQERFTAAVEIPSKDELLDYVLDVLEHGPCPLNLYVGATRVHPRDNYCKKTGRECAALAMKETELEFKMCLQLGERTCYTFEGTCPLLSGERIFHVTFSTVPHSTHVKIEDFNI